MLDRATRLCAISPTMATRSPLNSSLRSLSVNRSRSAWVGCSCQPSPPLMTEDLTPLAKVSAAPAAGWRSTMMSACIASMLRAVSSKVSPFTTLLEDGEKLITSALSRLAASSKDVRVLVLGSKNRFTTVFPRRAGTFLISYAVSCLKKTTVSRISLISSGDSDARLTRSFCLRLTVRLRLLVKNHDPVLFTFFFQQYAHDFFARRGDILPDVGGFDRQLSMPAVYQHGQLDLRRPAQIYESVHGRTDRAAGKQHIVHQHHLQVRDLEGYRGLPQNWLVFPDREIVTIERNVQFADRDLGTLDLLNPPCEPVRQMHAAGSDADQRHFLSPPVPLQDLMGDPGQFSPHLALIHDELFLLMLFLFPDNHRRPLIVIR